jgi:uncharacterized protein (TIGR03435 family)
MGNSRTRNLAKRMLAAATVAVITVTTPCGPTRAAQVAGPPLVFEAATIKPHLPANGVHFVCHATDNGMAPGSSPALGRCVIQGFTLNMLIGIAAYQVQTSTITGGPPWAGSDTFDIETKAEDPSTSTRDRLRQMIRSLLADRFKLTFHRESQEIGGFALVVDKNGAKLKEASNDDPPATPGNLPRATCLGSKSKYGAGLTGHNTAATCIATFLSDRLGRPVLDKTALSGIYNFTLEWVPGDNEVGPLSGPPVNNGDPTGPSLFSALQEQLGLRMESQKVPTQVIVIDRAEKPPEN